MAYLPKEQEGQAPAAVRGWGGVSAVQLFAFSPALAIVKEIILHGLKLQTST